MYVEIAHARRRATSRRTCTRVLEILSLGLWPQDSGGWCALTRALAKHKCTRWDRYRSVARI